MIGNIGGQSGGGANLSKSVLIVKALTGSTVSIRKGDIQKYATEKNGEWWFKGLENGEWTIRAEKSGKLPVEEKFNIPEFGVYRISVSYVKVYGIKRLLSSPSPEWERTDDALGMTATASVGDAPGKSDFSDKYPWSEVVRETVQTGDIMVKIPKFWYRRYNEYNDDGNLVEIIKISDSEIDGFKLHPAFNHVNMPSDCVYVGAYRMSNDGKSLPKTSPLVKKTRGNMRNMAIAKGTGWGLLDASSLSAIQMLYLVEFANNNSQMCIGEGVASGSVESPPYSGGCDQVPGLTGKPAGSYKDVIYRGIEGLWGGAVEFVDGAIRSQQYIKISNDQTKYAGSSDEYEELSYRIAGEYYIGRMGIDSGNNDHIMLPDMAGDGSSTTYYCDELLGSAYGMLAISGNSLNGDSCGIFYSEFTDASHTGTSVTSRLLYIPQGGGL